MSLVLTELELENFRKFRDPVRLAGLGPGLCLLAAPNEAGKSTLLAAMRGVLFEKHRSRAQVVQEFQSAGSKTAPRVKLSFLFGGARYTIEKRFLSREPFARLTLPDGNRVEGDAAEERLQELLRFSEPGLRGASDETIGLWSALLVQQGRSFLPPEFAPEARNQLEAALEAELGKLAGGPGSSAIPAAVDAALYEILSKRGAPKGRYAEVLAELDAIDRTLADLELKERLLADDIARLAEVRKELEAAEREDAAGTETKEIEAASGLRDEIVRRNARLGEAEAALTLARSGHERTRRAIEERNALKSAAAAAEERAATCAASRKEAEDAARVMAETLEAARQKATEVDARCQALRSAERAAAKRVEAARRAGEIAALKTRLGEARELQTRLGRLTDECAAIEIDQATVAALRTARTACDRAVAARDAGATEIRLGLNVPVRIDGVEKAPDSVLRVVTDTTIEIEGVGRIEIRPGVKDGRKLEGAAEAAAQRLKSLLDAAGADSVEAVESRFYEKQQKLGEIESLRRELARLAGSGPDAIDALSGKIASEEAGLTEDLAALGDEAPLALAQAQAAHREAVAAAEEAEAELLRVRSSLAEPERAAEAARKRALEAAAQEREATATRDRVAANLEAAIGERSLDELATELAEAEARMKAAEATYEMLRKEAAAGETLEQVDARLAQLEAAVARRKERIQTLQIERSRLSAAIQVQESDGLEEKIARLRRDRERLDRERQFFEREIKVLTLLGRTLAEAERQARERYLVPIVQRIEPYLEALFPGATLEVSESFAVKAVLRQGTSTAEEFGMLSAGTREQIAILVRLAVAEMLADQGRPAAVVLDDPLVFSDEDRLQRMLEILRKAAEKLQIVIFTCQRGGLFEGAGAATLSFENKRGTSCVAA